jgi:hypothetical protein
MELTIELKDFTEKCTWTFAKTYASTWPHEYIVQEKVDNEFYQKLAEHIDTYGDKQYFYSTQMIYFHHKDKVYWHIDNIINRCDESETYERREKENRLPK